MKENWSQIATGSTAIASKRHVPPMATFISSMHHYRQIVRKLRTISNCFFLFLGTTIVVS